MHDKLEEFIAAIDTVKGLTDTAWLQANSACVTGEEAAETIAMGGARASAELARAAVDKGREAMAILTTAITMLEETTATAQQAAQT